MNNERRSSDKADLGQSICTLYLLKNDPLFELMARNISINDSCLADFENGVVKSMYTGKLSEVDSIFLFFQTKIWLQMCYELLHKWKERAEVTKKYLQRYCAANDSGEKSHLSRMAGIELEADQATAELKLLDNSLGRVVVPLLQIKYLREHIDVLNISCKDGSMEYKFTDQDGITKGISRRDISNTLLSF